MPEARIRNYVKKNPERVEDWKNEVLRRHIIEVLTKTYGGDEVKEEIFSSYDIVKNRGQMKIFKDVMREHYNLCTIRSHSTSTYYRTDRVVIIPETFEEMIDGLGVKPEFNTEGVDKIYECDIYTDVRGMKLTSLVYVYLNQEEFTFLPKTTRGRYSSYHTDLTLGVFYKALAEEADHLSFRNAIDDNFSKNMAAVNEALFDKYLPDLNPIKPSYGGKDFEQVSHSFSSAHEELLPKHKRRITLEYLDKLVDLAEFRAKKLRDTADQLQEMRDSYVEAGGDETFDEFYYEKMIEYFYSHLPFYINSENKSLKEMATRAAQKEERFH